MTDFENAVQYVKDNHQWSEAREAVALERINHNRCSIEYADSGIADEIVDLMEEYGADNDLPEGWWMDEGDVDSIFMNL